MDKDFIQINKQILEFRAVLSKLEKDYEIVQTIKTNTKISKTYLADVKDNVNKSTILENIGLINKTMNQFSTDVSEIKGKVSDIDDFLEKFRTIRIYKLDDQKKIFRFISGFLEGFSEYFTFKPEFLGVVDLNQFALEINGKKEGSGIKVSYENLPGLIDAAYSKGLRNFVLESNSLKLIFSPNYVVKIMAENEMIKKVDKVAKEIGVQIGA